MKRKKFSRAMLLFSFMLVFLLSSCSFVRIQNVAATTATVSVRVLDSGKAYVRTIRSGAIVDVFSSHGGSYTISMRNDLDIFSKEQMTLWQFFLQFVL
ncbi:MAG: hypothetical protein HN390_08415 [Anaerolineae bacterium]|jgi:hypothetical protein|nr:hypothetical protein [Anaerolineae bacterium]MBT7189401.1 hypothetical protein [Anaerolineae bacterium]MBT7991988.1 hypothetical protein [Anaerolineae bacterium]